LSPRSRAIRIVRYTYWRAEQGAGKDAQKAKRRQEVQQKELDFRRKSKESKKREKYKTLLPSDFYDAFVVLYVLSLSSG
jgi:hypothetical protein